MQEEITRYKFANSKRFLTEAIEATSPRHMIELGGWYGTIASYVSRIQTWGSYTVYEAVTEIAVWLKNVVAPGVIVRNNTISYQHEWRPVFHADRADTVSTSGLYTEASNKTTELAVGTCLTPQQLVESHRECWTDAGFKSNIEGMDLDVVTALLDAQRMPKFMLFEIFGRERARLWSIWPRIAQHYGLSPVAFTDLTGPVLHIGVYAGRLCWWTVLPDSSTPYNEQTFEQQTMIQ